MIAGSNFLVEFTAVPFMKCSIDWFTSHANFDPGTAARAVITNHNLTVTGVSPGDGGAFVFANEAKSSGKYYFEIKFVSLVGGFLLGGEIGIASTSATLNDISGAINSTMLFRGPNFTTGQIWSSAGYSGYHLGLISEGDVIGIAVDLDNGKLWFKNVTQGGAWNGTAAAGDPAANINGVDAPSGPTIPAVAFGVSNDVYTANFGATVFAGTVPSGFTSGWVV
ncbi:hypothetical protein HAP47_0020620 [Bradyrhizobium sp. 41S5]|uniref:SPRY domain-containing protein n=1 Tax=Bradyrhizobium sp. 41S5 TaxID=1404443 RepID=UPI00156A843E|nr:SPRY domain-containing protein [Bradyrhizobium sp. 41S5]UFX41718.1 hypothetical protein HAP47_0020620 [Bradyrhizobium sp. 41S5]